MNILERIKSLMRFPSRGQGGGAYHAQGFSSWDDLIASRFKGSQINYAAEVGNLHQSSIVMTAVNWAGTRLPEALPKVYKKDGEGKFVEVEEHPLTELMESPNPYMDDGVMAQAFALNDIIDGNVFWRKVKNGRGKVVQLWPIPFWCITPRWNEKDETEYIGWYEYKVNQKKELIPPEEIIHFRRGVNPDNDRRGLSPLGSLLREIYQDNEVGNFAAALMKNGGIPDFILSPSDSSGATGFSDSDARFLQEEFQRRRTGDERGKAIASKKGIKIEKLTFEPDKLDLSALRKVPESRLAAVIGIPASALGLYVGIENNTYSNAKELGEDATEGFLTPLWKRIGKTLTKQLLPDFEKNPGFKVMYDTSEVRALQEDKTEQYKRNTIAFQGDWMKKSEVRADAGLKVGPEDEVYLSDIKAAQAQATAELEAERMENMPDDMREEEPFNRRKKSLASPTKEELAGMEGAWIRHVPAEARGLYRGANGKH